MRIIVLVYRLSVGLLLIWVYRTQEDLFPLVLVEHTNVFATTPTIGLLLAS